MNPCFETASRLARAIRNGRLSSVEATSAHLERIARLNGPLNALVVVDRDAALKAARLEKESHSVIPGQQSRKTMLLRQNANAAPMLRKLSSPIGVS